MTDLAKLVVKLEAQTAEFSKQLEKAQGQLKKFNKESSVSAASIAKGLATAAAAAAAALAYVGKQVINTQDHLSKMSQSLGMSTESLSQLSYAADLSGTSAEEFEKALGKLSKNAFAAARDGGTLTKVWDQLGVTLKNSDGTLRSNEELLLDVADQFSKMEDGVAKTGMAMEVFGKSGAKLIPFLNQGREGITALMQEADALGVTLDTEAGRAAEQFNDNLTRLKTAATGVVNQATQAFLPTLVALTDRFVKSAKEGGGFKVAIELLAGTFKTLVSAGIIVKSVFEQLGRVVYGVGAAVVRVAQGEFRLAKEEITSAFAEAQANVTGDLELIAQVWSDTVPQVTASAQAMDAALEDTIIFSPEKAGSKAADAAAKAREALAGMVADLQQQVAVFGQGEEAVLAYRMAHGDLAKLIAEGGPGAAEYAYQISQLSEKLRELEAAEAAQKEALENDNRLKEEGRALTESLRTEAEIYGDTLRRLNELHDMGFIATETYQRGLEQAQKTFEESTQKNNAFLEQASRNVQDIIAENLENGFERGAKGMLDSFMQMLKQMAAQAVAAQIGAMIFGGEGVGSGGGWIGKAAGFLGGLFTGGGMAAGGTMHAGRAYRVGDQGRAEWFVPPTPGRLIAAGADGGSSMVVNQSFTISAPQGTVSQATRQQIAADAARGLAMANRRNN